MLRTWIVEPDVWLAESLFSENEAVRLFRAVDREAAWRTHVVRMFGRQIPSPRRTAWQSDEGVTYSYSGITLESAPWTDAVMEIRLGVERATGERFNSALINKYRNGSDSMGWHADDEKELGDEPLIASVSLGGARRFLLKHNETGERVDLVLPSGSLLVMGGRSQHFWKHALPKTKKDVGSRINLTFRRILG
ncbi:MAG: alpha-ketoglutarate-dependent dioxygenase AlkB [Rhodothermales bacterium]|nr:alpha-ketoglutarate-dependent dioxygenase AlkB [Rhodothermales bacterium]